MFNVNYDDKTGRIVSYQEGGAPEDNIPPEGCSTLSFASFYAPMFDENGTIKMKVDVENKELVFLNPVVIPKPVSAA